MFQAREQVIESFRRTTRKRDWAYPELTRSESIDGEARVVLNQFQQCMEDGSIMVETSRQPMGTHLEGLPVPGKIRPKIHADKFVRSKDTSAVTNGITLDPRPLALRIKVIRIDARDRFERYNAHAPLQHRMLRSMFSNMPLRIFRDSTFYGFHHG